MSCVAMWEFLNQYPSYSLQLQGSLRQKATALKLISDCRLCLTLLAVLSHHCSNTPKLEQHNFNFQCLARATEQCERISASFSRPQQHWQAAQSCRKLRACPCSRGRRRHLHQPGAAGQNAGLRPAILPKCIFKHACLFTICLGNSVVITEPPKSGSLLSHEALSKVGPSGSASSDLLKSCDVSSLAGGLQR